MTSTKPTVLIVEDDSLVRSFLAQALEMGGYPSEGVGSGTEGLAALQGSNRFAVLLIDGLLPDMHGADLAHRILDTPGIAQLPLCFISGALRQAPPNTAGVAALAKPVKARTLLDTVRELCSWAEGPRSSPSERRAVLDALTGAFLVGP